MVVAAILVLDAGDDVPDDPLRSRLAAVSDRIIEAVRALRATEAQKRQATPSTPEYHRLVEESAAKSKEIFDAAAEQDRLARQLKPGGETIEETSAREEEEERGGKA